MAEQNLDKVLEKIKSRIEHRICNIPSSVSYDGDLYNGALKDGLYEALDMIEEVQKELENQKVSVAEEKNEPEYDR